MYSIAKHTLASLQVVIEVSGGLASVSYEIPHSTNLQTQKNCRTLDTCQIKYLIYNPKQEEGGEKNYTFKASEAIKSD